MKRIQKIIKKQLLFNFLLVIFFCAVFLPVACFCYEPVQTITITKEDIINAKPTVPYPVRFSQKDLKAIEIMERRHFPRTYPELSDDERLKNLEYELLGRVWKYSMQSDRIKTLKLASSNTMLIGTALPTSISSKRMAKRIQNDSIQLRQRENVGLIDGFLKLINPQIYDKYRQRSEELYYKYEY